jgi:hypothetical protein
MKLVENAHMAWRWISVQAFGLIALLPIVWVALPPEGQALVPEQYRPWVTSAVALAGLAGRLVKQKGAE